MTQYTGGCHCGAVRFDVDMTIGQPIRCNCSICQKRGSLLSFAPRSAFHLEKGADELTEYRFNTEKIAHLFCKICGVESFAYAAAPDGTEMVAVNVNCLDGVEPGELTPRHYDGRAR